MTTAPVASVRGVSHAYGTTRALDALDLDIPAGCMVGLIGPDGVGKSTLMGLIAGSKRIQAGEVRVLGGDMADAAHRDAACPRIAFMPQGLGKNLYLELSVFENIDFFARLFGVPDAERAGRITALLDATGLGPFPDRPAGKLSGGMKQKVGLCGALIHDPDLLILDEPTTGVDPLSRQQFWTLIDRIRARTARHERAGLHRLHGRGPAVRLDHRHGRRPRHRHRHSRPAHGTHRRRRTWRRRSSRCCPAPRRAGAAPW